MGIDSVASIIAFLFFLVGFAGIALVVINSTRGQAVRGGVLTAVAGFGLGVLFFIVSEGILVVGPTQRAVVFNNLSGELENPRDPGIHVVLPVIQETTLYRVSRQEYTMSGIDGEGSRNQDDAIVARSVDGQEVFIDVTIIFTINPEDVNTVHRNWSDVQQGYLEGLIRPTVRSITRDVIATARAEEIFGSRIASSDNAEEVVATNNPTSRIEVQDTIEQQVAEQLGEEGFTVIEILLREINFSPDFIDAIEQRQVAELDRDRAEIEAERARIQAGGRANARIEEARGEAEAIRVRAQADADALRVVSEQIAANPNLIQYTYITELSDNVELVLLPSNSQFIFDPATFTDLGSDFTAPQGTPIVPDDNNGTTTPEGDGQ